MLAGLVAGKPAPQAARPPGTCCAGEAPTLPVPPPQAPIGHSIPQATHSSGAAGPQGLYGPPHMASFVDEAVWAAQDWKWDPHSLTAAPADPATAGKGARKGGEAASSKLGCQVRYTACGRCGGLGRQCRFPQPSGRRLAAAGWGGGAAAGPGEPRPIVGASSSAAVPPPGACDPCAPASHAGGFWVACRSPLHSGTRAAVQSAQAPCAAPLRPPPAVCPMGVTAPPHACARAHAGLMSRCPARRWMAAP